jgi:PadR family transcriptional regulator PadR
MIFEEEFPMIKKEPRLSHQTLRVLRSFMEQPKEWLAGSDIWNQTRTLSGTLYPILMRLEKARWLESKWEQLDPSEGGRPRKRFYRLTALGYNKANAALAELSVSHGRPAWNS